MGSMLASVVERHAKSRRAPTATDETRRSLFMSQLYCGALARTVGSKGYHAQSADAFAFDLGTVTTMAATANATELLFSYGTLQLESVQLATFGRKLTGSQDALPGFSLSLLKIEDPDVIVKSGKTDHPIIKFTGRSSDVVQGTVFQITSEELANADKYEVAAYKRASVALASGRRAWVYADVRYAPPA
jgi:hypothetical protein